MITPDEKKIIDAISKEIDEALEIICRRAIANGNKGYFLSAMIDAVSSIAATFVIVPNEPFTDRLHAVYHTSLRNRFIDAIERTQKDLKARN